jgi:hypothetical protein
MHSFIQKNICNLAFVIIPSLVPVGLMMILDIAPIPDFLFGDRDILCMDPL